MKITFTIPRQLPSANRVLGLDWRARHRVNKQWYDVTRMYYLASVSAAERTHVQSLLGEQNVRYRIVITARLFRLYDEDNLWVKAVVDALKGFVITDDAPKYATIEKYQEKIQRATAADKRKGIKGPEPSVLVEVEVVEL